MQTLDNENAAHGIQVALESASRQIAGPEPVPWEIGPAVSPIFTNRGSNPGPKRDGIRGRKLIWPYLSAYGLPAPFC